MRRAYVFKPATITAPIVAFSSRPAGALFGWTEAQKAEWTLAIAVRNLPGAEAYVAHCCTVLGDANRMRGPMKRVWQAKAMRSINCARAQLRAARAALAVAEVAMIQLPLFAAPGLALAA